MLTVFRCGVSLLVASCLLAGVMSAQAETPAKPRQQSQQQRKPNPVFEQIQDEPGLPRVLIIGDSISMGYTLPVRKLLAGKANVHRPAVNCGPTTRGVQGLEQWLGDGKWDVIHFNFGLHDLRIVDEKLNPKRVGELQVPLADYEKNLDAIAERLKKTGAKVIWRNTTPVPEGSALREPGTELKYNEVAAKVMAKHGIPTQDLYSFVQPRMDELMLPKNVHFTAAGSDALAEQVANLIKENLPKSK